MTRLETKTKTTPSCRDPGGPEFTIFMNLIDREPRDPIDDLRKIMTPGPLGLYTKQFSFLVVRGLLPHPSVLTRLTEKPPHWVGKKYQK